MRRNTSNNMLRIISCVLSITVGSSFSHVVGWRIRSVRSKSTTPMEVVGVTSSYYSRSFITNGNVCIRRKHSLKMSSSSSSDNNYGPPVLQLDGAARGENTVALPEEENITMMPASPALSFRKFVTMQEKRIVVAITYSEGSGLRPFFLTAAQRIKAAHPDVLIEKQVVVSNEASFEIRVDGKVLGMGGKNNDSDYRHAADGRAVFVSMEELALSISKARKKRRPTTIYGDGSMDENSNSKSNSNNGKRTTRANRLEMLKKTMNNRQ